MKAAGELLAFDRTKESRMLKLRTAAVAAAMALMLVGGAMAQMPPPGHHEHAGPPGGPHHGMMPFEHVEGTLAFLHAELRLTDAQTAPWEAFTAVVRTQAAALKADHDAHEAQERAGKLQSVTVPEAIAEHVRVLELMRDAAKKVQAVLVPLYGALTDEQKKAADGLLHDMMCD
jgi:hypothetical protein